MKPRSNGGRSPLAKDDGKGPFRTILALRAVRDLPDTINGTRISQTAKHVLTDLIGRANSHGVSWASAEALAADVSVRGSWLSCTARNISRTSTRSTTSTWSSWRPPRQMGQSDPTGEAQMVPVGIQMVPVGIQMGQSDPTRWVRATH